MNGKEVHLWKDCAGFQISYYRGGYVFGHTAQRDPEYGFQDEVDLVQVDWEGNIVWRFNRLEHIKDQS